MTVKELVKTLENLNPEWTVCGQSETSTWDLTTMDIKIEPIIIDGVLKQRVIVGYIH